MATSLGKPMHQRFYFVMALIIAAVVIAGFGPTVDARLFHPTAPRPVILYVHAAVFSAWIVFFIAQTALVGWRNTAFHRKLGLWGALLGAAVPILGVATAIAVDRLEGHHGDDDAAFLAASFYDMLAFAVAFGFAIHWRKRPEFHRRLMLIATCGLCSAAIARIMPAAPLVWTYAGVDGLILLGVVRDLIVDRRIHTVYRVSLPAIVVGQTIALYLYLDQMPAWLAIARRLIG